MVRNVSSKTLKYVESFSPTLKGEPIMALKWGDRYRYLGVPFGRTRVTSLNDLKKTIIGKAKAICSSLLTDWQKVDAINTFVMRSTSTAWWWLSRILGSRKRSVTETTQYWPQIFHPIQKVVLPRRHQRLSLNLEVPLRPLT